MDRKQTARENMSRFNCFRKIYILMILGFCLVGCTTSTNLRSLHYLDGKLVASPPADERAYAAYLRARLAMEQTPAHYLEARQHIQDALQYAPKDAHLWTVCGQIELYLGNPREAFLASQRALQLQPNYPPARQLAASVQQASPH